MLVVVSNVAVGVDNVDLDACRARGVVVTNTPGVLTEATADLAFGLLLAASRRIAEGDRMIRTGDFVGWGPSLLVGKRVSGAGNFYEPTVLANIPKTNPVYYEEIFGPVAMLFRASGVDEAIEIANDSDFGLASSVWTHSSPSL